MDFKKSAIVNKEVVKKTEYNELNTEVIKLKKNIPDTSTLIHINQYNKINKVWEKRFWSKNIWY